MLKWLQKAFGSGDPPARQRRRPAPEETTHRNPPAKLPPIRVQVPERIASLPVETPPPNPPTGLPSVPADAQPQVHQHKFTKGDRIGGEFQVNGILGQGGFGIVLLALDLRTKQACALKTFRQELLANPQARAAFQLEARRWADLGEHPHILTARAVKEIGNRLFVKMDYIAPDANGRVTLADHIRGHGSRPIPLWQQLVWGIQFCFGMEHANQQGIRCHCDIKPNNILIDGSQSLKISDFGLAMATESAIANGASAAPSAAGNGPELTVSVFNAGGRHVCGTLGYIPPELCRGALPDVRSDLYSFGLVLWQLATSSRMPPFIPSGPGSFDAWLREIYEAQMAAPAPAVAGPQQPIIAKCLDKSPEMRYRDFRALRVELAALLKRETNMVVTLPEKAETTGFALYERAVALFNIKRHKEALDLFDQALKLSPWHTPAKAGRSSCLVVLGRGREALQCCDEILKADPQNRIATHNKAAALEQLRRRAEALEWYDKTARQSPDSAPAWQGMARCLSAVGKFREAIACSTRALELHPRDPAIWCEKGEALKADGRDGEALACFDEALAHDPLYVAAWLRKSAVFSRLKQHAESIQCLEKALAIDPRHAEAWYNKGLSQEALQHIPEAVESLKKFLECARPHQSTMIVDGRARWDKLKRIASAAGH